MSKVINIWKWSFGVVAGSYRAIVLVTILLGLWGIGGFELLGVPAESSVLLMLVATVWAVAQLLLAGIVAGGIVAWAGAAAVGVESKLSLRSVWKLGRRNMFVTIAFGILSLAIVWGFSSAFDWINDHALEIASFLTFHSQKPVNEAALESHVLDVVEWIVWVMVSGFLLSYFVVLLHAGWQSARKLAPTLLAGCIYKTPFLTSVLSVLVFSGLAHVLAGWHPPVAAGFWDYAQVIARFSIILALLVAGAMFWTLSLARLFLVTSDSPER